MKHAQAISEDMIIFVFRNRFYVAKNETMADCKITLD